MGLQDSTKTRVEPVFDELLARDETGNTWLSKLVALPARPGVVAPVVPPAPLTRCGWGDEEVGLPAPCSLLAWLVRNAVLVDQEAHRKTSKSTRAKRELLLKHDAATADEAMRLLSREPVSARAWYVLEGVTRPDVYLESEKCIVVIEGKRTEPGPTISTTWMATRHQMLRHLDCAWECRRGRDVLGFFIVEGEGGASALSVPSLWQAAVEMTVRTDVLKASLPHRNEAEREAIARGFLGATTWQRVCRESDISWAELPDSAPTAARMTRSRNDLLQSCEDHLYFLRDAYRLYHKGQRPRYKQIAGELRVLVCRTRHNHPLLLDLMDAYKFTYDVQPPEIGIFPYRLFIPMVGQSALEETEEEEVVLRDTLKPEELARAREAAAWPVPLREFVDYGLAVSFAPDEYSYRDLVLMVAQQFGSSHEDPKLKWSIADLRAARDGEHSAAIGPLLELAEVIIKAGSEFIAFLQARHGYKPTYSWEQPTGPP